MIHRGEPIDTTCHRWDREPLHHSATPRQIRLDWEKELEEREQRATRNMHLEDTHQARELSADRSIRSNGHTIPPSTCPARSPQTDSSPSAHDAAQTRRESRKKLKAEFYSSDEAADQVFVMRASQASCETDSSSSKSDREELPHRRLIPKWGHGKRSGHKTTNSEHRQATNASRYVSEAADFGVLPRCVENSGGSRRNRGRGKIRKNTHGSSDEDVNILIDKEINKRIAAIAASGTDQRGGDEVSDVQSKSQDLQETHDVATSLKTLLVKIDARNADPGGFKEIMKDAIQERLRHAKGVSTPPGATKGDRQTIVLSNKVGRPMTKSTASDSHMAPSKQETTETTSPATPAKRNLFAPRPVISRRPLHDSRAWWRLTQFFKAKSQRRDWGFLIQIWRLWVDVTSESPHRQRVIDVLFHRTLSSTRSRAFKHWKFLYKGLKTVVKNAHKISMRIHSRISRFYFYVWRDFKETDPVEKVLYMEPICHVTRMLRISRHFNDEYERHLCFLGWKKFCFKTHLFSHLGRWIILRRLRTLLGISFRAMTQSVQGHKVLKSLALRVGKSATRTFKRAVLSKLRNYCDTKRTLLMMGLKVATNGLRTLMKAVMWAWFNIVSKHALYPSDHVIPMLAQRNHRNTKWACLYSWNQVMRVQGQSRRFEWYIENKNDKRIMANYTQQWSVCTIRSRVLSCAEKHLKTVLCSRLLAVCFRNWSGLVYHHKLVNRKGRAAIQALRSRTNENVLHAWRIHVDIGLRLVIMGGRLYRSEVVRINRTASFYHNQRQSYQRRVTEHWFAGAALRIRASMLRTICSAWQGLSLLNIRRRGLDQRMQDQWQRARKVACFTNWSEGIAARESPGISRSFDASLCHGPGKDLQSCSLSKWLVSCHTLARQTTLLLKSSMTIWFSGTQQQRCIRNQFLRVQARLNRRRTRAHFKALAELRRCLSIFRGSALLHHFRYRHKHMTRTVLIAWNSVSNMQVRTRTKHTHITRMIMTRINNFALATAWKFWLMMVVSKGKFPSSAAHDTDLGRMLDEYSIWFDEAHFVRMASYKVRQQEGKILRMTILVSQIKKRFHLLMPAFRTWLHNAGCWMPRTVFGQALVSKALISNSRSDVCRPSRASRAAKKCAESCLQLVQRSEDPAMLYASVRGLTDVISRWKWVVRWAKTKRHMSWRFSSGMLRFFWKVWCLTVSKKHLLRQAAFKIEVWSAVRGKGMHFRVWAVVSRKLLHWKKRLSDKDQRRSQSLVLKCLWSWAHVKQHGDSKALLAASQNHVGVQTYSKHLYLCKRKRAPGGDKESDGTATNSWMGTSAESSTSCSDRVDSTLSPRGSSIAHIDSEDDLRAPEHCKHDQLGPSSLSHPSTTRGDAGCLQDSFHDALKAALQDREVYMHFVSALDEIGLRYDQRISLPQFRELVMQLPQGVSAAQIEELFQTLDVFAEGSLNPKELKLALQLDCPHDAPRTEHSQETARMAPAHPSLQSCICEGWVYVRKQQPWGHPVIKKRWMALMSAEQDSKSSVLKLSKTSSPSDLPSAITVAMLEGDQETSVEEAGERDSLLWFAVTEKSGPGVSAKQGISSRKISPSPGQRAGDGELRRLFGCETEQERNHWLYCLRQFLGTADIDGFGGGRSGRGEKVLSTSFSFL